MIKVYIRNAAGQKVTVEVTDEVAEAMKESYKAELRNDAKEKYYRGRTLDTLSDDAVELRRDRPERGLMTASPEDEYIAAEERSDYRARLLTALKSLTAIQFELVKMLRKGLTVTEIARLWGKNQKTVYECYEAVQKKFKEFLR